MEMHLPWKCEDCKYELKDEPLFTYVDCPKCGSENFYHGDMIYEDDFDVYNIVDDE